MREHLLDILAANASADAITWLKESIATGEAGFEKRPFYYAFSGVSRHFHKQALVTATDSQAQALQNENPDFTVSGWDEFRLARVILLLHLADQDEKVFLETIDALLNTADLREQAAIFSAYPLLPAQADLVESAIDGLRSNIVDIYDAIALGNAFPATSFSDEAWNQMILKTFFINRPLYRVIGIENRANTPLTEAISDLAHERWAAGRAISAEAWRNCAAFPTERILSDFAHLLENGDASDREALALIVAGNSDQSLDGIRDQVKAELSSVESRELTWESLGRSLEDTSPALNGSPSDD
ncbi:EboA domain-containing protein [Verrucomicrobiales bacterium]|jgi:hypothetical protein|nr:EboA domain-containing protein [Verrucomicrobiales bacterium]